MAFAPTKQVFLALIAVSWADGRLSAAESGGLLHAASAAGLSVDDLGEVQDAMKKRIDLSWFDPAGMSVRERIVTYALALWLARLDGIVTTEEHATLRSLGDKLGLDRHSRERASSVAFDVFMLPQGSRPDRYDFAALDALVTARLPQHGGA